MLGPTPGAATLRIVRRANRVRQTGPKDLLTPDKKIRLPRTRKPIRHRDEQLCPCQILAGEAGQLILDDAEPVAIQPIDERVNLAEYARPLAIYQGSFDDIQLADRKERVIALSGLYV